MKTPTIEEMEAAWDRLHVARIPGHDMTNECRLAARVLLLEGTLEHVARVASKVECAHPATERWTTVGELAKEVLP